MVRNNLEWKSQEIWNSYLIETAVCPGSGAWLSLFHSHFFSTVMGVCCIQNEDATKPFYTLKTLSYMDAAYLIIDITLKSFQALLNAQITSK